MKEFGSMVDYAKIARRSAVEKLRDKEVKGATFEGVKVLVAEDNVVNQKMMKKMFEKLGVPDVTIVENGKLATEITERESFDAIFMDMEMPVMDGLEACRIIMSRNGPPQKITFLTAHVASHAEAACRESGAKSFLSKPVTIKDLRSELELLLAD